MSIFKPGRELFANCLDIQEAEGGIIPLRFTRNQLKAYEANPARRMRSLCPAGAAIDLITDSKFVKITCNVLDKTRNWIYLDLFVNGVFVDSEGIRPIEQDEQVFLFELPVENGFSRVTIYLPHNIQLVIKEVELSPGAIKKLPEPYKNEILCLGDSITHGMDAFHPSATYPVLLSRFLDMKLLNQGVGGYVFDENSLDPDIGNQPEIITVAYGTNDWKACATADELKEKCSAYIKKLVGIYPASRIFVMTPFWRADLNETRNMGSFFDVADIIKDSCKGFKNIEVVDGLTLIPHMPAFFGDERVHPNEEGFYQIALNLLKRIKA